MHIFRIQTEEKCHVDRQSYHNTHLLNEFAIFAPATTISVHRKKMHVSESAVWQTIQPLNRRMRTLIHDDIRCSDDDGRVKSGRFQQPRQ